MHFDRIGLIEIILEEIFWNRLRAPYNQRFVQNLGFKGSERVLEFGSGSGAISRHLLPILEQGGGRLICSDTSAGLMAIARKRLKGISCVEFLEGDLRAQKLAKESFDAIVVHFVLHDIPAPEREPLVREMARILKPGGTLFVREPIRKGHGMAPEEIRALAASAGLTESSSATGRRMGWVPFFSALYLKGNGRGRRP